MDYTQYTDKVNDKVKKLFEAETPDVKSKIKFGFNSYEERKNIAFLAGKYAAVLVAENDTQAVLEDTSRKLGIFLSSLEASCVANAIEGFRGYMESDETAFSKYIGDTPNYVNGPRFSLTQKAREDVVMNMNKAPDFGRHHSNILVMGLFANPQPDNAPMNDNDNTKGALRLDIAQFRNESLNQDTKNKNTPT